MIKQLTISVAVATLAACGGGTETDRYATFQNTDNANRIAGFDGYWRCDLERFDDNRFLNAELAAIEFKDGRIAEHYINNQGEHSSDINYYDFFTEYKRPPNSTALKKFDYIYVFTDQDNPVNAPGSWSMSWRNTRDIGLTNETYSDQCYRQEWGEGLVVNAKTQVNTVDYESALSAYTEWYSSWGREYEAYQRGRCSGVSFTNYADMVSRCGFGPDVCVRRETGQFVAETSIPVTEEYCRTTAELDELARNYSVNVSGSGDLNSNNSYNGPYPIPKEPKKEFERKQMVLQSEL